MNLEQQVVSLDLAKRLKELGIKQESHFVWEYYNDQCFTVKYIPYAIVPDEFNKFEWFSAFSASELGDILPMFIQATVSETSSHDGKYYLETFKGIDDKWGIGYVMDSSLPPLVAFINDTEANIRAKSLIWLIENGHIKI